VLEVFHAKAARVGSRLTVVSEKEGLESALAGEHQKMNAATAACAMREALPGISDQAIRQGLASVRWPGRCQILPTEPRILLDGAHNVQAVEALVRSAPGLLGHGPIHLVFGAARDKDIETMAQRLRDMPGLERTTVVNLPHERGAAADVLTAYFPGAMPAQGWEDAWALVREAGIPTLVTGSLFLVGEALRFFEQPAARVDLGELWATSSV
jgi:dihydrofolate synthase/folylpolyglutamate synthase